MILLPLNTKILSTSGGEFLSMPTKEEYIGLYHYSQGIPYRGVNLFGPDTRLYDIRFGVESINYTRMKPLFGQHLNDPVAYKPVPTKKEYVHTRVTRYFVKNLHTKLIIEVDKASYKVYAKKNLTLKYLYAAIKLIWKISGPRYDVYAPGGMIKKTGVEDTNQRTMALHKAVFPELPLVLPLDDLAKITS